jgi:hypothetical protein
MILTHRLIVSSTLPQRKPLRPRFTRRAELRASASTALTTAVEATGAEIRCGGYVLVDDALRTSAPHIFAAGDIAERMMLVQRRHPRREPRRRTNHAVSSMGIYRLDNAYSADLND